ncbi:MAG: DUF1549 domain-containing protein [Planctomycetaceae bacterium]|nr:DUF1549 domain-containing protein [Planctomycetaceae bacterium]
MLNTTLVSVGLLVAAAAPAEAPRIDLRYAKDGVTETPDFREHVVPLMGKLGCNGRACHGSFQGQGGFRLSLFGYDFKADHENLMAGDEPRTNVKSPNDSLILQKPTLGIPHEGGRRLTEGTWQHRVMQKWVVDGAKPMAADAPDFVRLDVTPNEMIAKAKGDTWQLKAVAVWSDGCSEDVSPLCRFSSNNDQVATITEAGLVTAMGPGDTHVVAFYDNGVVPVPVIHPVSDKVGPKYPKTPTPTVVDQLVVQKLAKLGIVQSETATDAEFLRRVSLDIAGTLPTGPEVQAFLDDQSPDKRAKKIDQLLDSPAYAAWWATKFADWTGNNSRYNNNNFPGGREAVSNQWYEWLHRQLEQNQAYDKLVENIVLAKSRNDGETYREYCERVSSYYDKDSGKTFADSPSLPHYWSRTNFRQVDEKALGFAYTFLGLRIQCAQCHKHPFDQWTKDDFDRFKGFFARVKSGDAPGTKEQAKEMLAGLDIDMKGKNAQAQARELAGVAAKGKVIPFQELYVDAGKPTSSDRKKGNDKGKKQQVVAGRTAKVLGGEEISIEDMDDPRTALMEWMKAEDNPYFAKAFVNRVWASYFHRGIVEPADDLSLANPACNAELLDHLADGFRKSGYDMKWVHREIANSRTYQLSWQANETNRLDERNFSRAVPRRIPAEVAYDAVRQATASDEESAKFLAEVKTRSIADPIVTTQNNGKNKYALTVFGRSIRESNCDCDRSMEPSLLQTVFLQNDQELLDMIDRRGGWVDQMLRTSSGNSADDDADRKQVERQIDKLEDGLKKAKASDNEKRVKQAEELLAAARKRAKELQKVDETPVPADADRIAEIVKQAYLRSVNRLPTSTEQQRAAAYFQESGDMKVGTRDLLWALLNTKEFVVNH